MYLYCRRYVLLSRSLCLLEQREPPPTRTERADDGLLPFVRTSEERIFADESGQDLRCVYSSAWHSMCCTYIQQDLGVRKYMTRRINRLSKICGHAEVSSDILFVSQHFAFHSYVQYTQCKLQYMAQLGGIEVIQIVIKGRWEVPLRLLVGKLNLFALIGIEDL